MKATSIEQIREHLAKGGRALAVLKDGRTDEVKRVDMGMLRVYAGIWSSSFACVDVDHWQLLPLEEKEPVDHGTQKCEWECNSEFDRWETSCEDMITRQGNNEHPRAFGFKFCPFCSLEIVWVGPMPDGTQKGQEEEYIEVERVCHIPAPCEMRLNKRIRTRLLHGQWPEMSDLLSWWEATTGERIEHGKRCDTCNCSGLAQEGRIRACEDCQGSGYSVRPTWMNQ